LTKLQILSYLSTNNFKNFSTVKNLIPASDDSP